MMNSANLEHFVHDVLKEDLKVLEQHMNHYNDEIMEFVQLKNTIQTLNGNVPDGYKTQMHIGGNIFMEAKVEQPQTMLVNLGKDYYLECSLQETLQFADARIKQLTKEADVLREESVKKRSEIKLALMYIAEQEKLHVLGEAN